MDWIFAIERKSEMSFVSIGVIIPDGSDAIADGVGYNEGIANPHSCLEGWTTPLTASPLIQLHEVSYVYHQAGDGQIHALSDLTFHVDEGEYVAVIGLNGSGKSTLARLLCGLLLPTTGTVSIDGFETVNPAHRAEIHQRVGMVFQQPDNQMVATIVEDDIAFGLENHCVPRDAMHRRVDDALALVGMTEHRRRPPHQLSGGQKQRVAIAGVWALQPRCIVFDEATSMLDAPGRDDVCRLMATLHQSGVTVVTITHHMNEVVDADRIIVLNQGRIAMQGSPRDVFTQVDRLQSFGLDVPIAADIAYRLRQIGVRIPNNPVTHEELAQALAVVTDTPPAATSPHRSDGRREPQSSQSEQRPIIEVDDVSFTYLQGTPMAYQALDHVSLAVKPGAFFAIVGQTGSGKSTLIQLLNGLQLPTRGRVQVVGIDTAQAVRNRLLTKQLRSAVGLVFQQPEDQLFEPLIGDDIAYGPFQLGLSVDDARERVRFAMEAVGLDFSWRDRPTYGLSGGEKRKVAIAGVLAMMPSILVLDEPTAGLDPRSREDLLNALKALNSGGMTIVMVSHQMEDVTRFADEICVLGAGRVLAQEPPHRLFADEQRLSRLGIAEPEPTRLMRTLERTGRLRVNPLCFDRDHVFTELTTALRHRHRKGGGCLV